MIALRRLLQRQRRRLLILTVIGILCMAVAWAHSGVGEDHMGEAVAVCLAVLEAGVAGLLTTVLLLRARVLPRRSTNSLQPHPLLTLAAPGPTPILPRAGPALLQVFLR